MRFPLRIERAVLLVAARVVFYTLLWYTFSIGITFYNKWLFQWYFRAGFCVLFYCRCVMLLRLLKPVVCHRYGFHFPLIVTSIHMT